MKRSFEHNKYFRNYNCKAFENTIKFENLTNQRLIPEFINSLKRLHFKFRHKNNFRFRKC